MEERENTIKIWRINNVCCFLNESIYKENNAFDNITSCIIKSLSFCSESMNAEEKDQFWKSVQCTVEKDVIRTDRSHTYFKGDGNPNIDILEYVVVQTLKYLSML